MVELPLVDRYGNPMQVEVPEPAAGEKKLRGRVQLVRVH